MLTSAPSMWLGWKGRGEAVKARLVTFGYPVLVLIQLFHFKEQLGMEKPEKYQRQRAKKRIYVDSNTGQLALVDMKLRFENNFI